MKALEKYLAYMAAHIDKIRAIRLVDGAGPPGFGERIHAFLPVARIFEVDGPSYADAVRVTFDLACDTFDESKPHEWLDTWNRTRLEVPFPALPFPVVWVGFSPVCDRIEQRAALTFPLMQRQGIFPPGRLISSELIGVLLAEIDEERGFAAAVYAEHLDTLPGHTLYSTSPICDPDLGWLNAHTGEWYAIAQLGAHIASAAVEEKPVSAATRLAYRKSRVSQHKAPPQPWYRVHGTMSPEPILRRDFAGAVQRAISFRHDRAAHDRLYLQRGVGIPSRDTLERLVDRGYQVWMGSIDDERVLALMHARGHEPRRDDEWVATKVVRIEATVVGDESLPYFPGVRSR